MARFSIRRRAGSATPRNVTRRTTGSPSSSTPPPHRRDDGGAVSGSGTSPERSRAISGLFSSVWGLAWSADRKEVFVTASKQGMGRALVALSLGGRERLIARVPQALTLHDVAQDGRVLIAQDLIRQGVRVRAPGEPTEREFGWRDFTSVAPISNDGKTVYICESGEGSSPGYDLYLRRTDGSPPVRLGEGGLVALSPDGKWVFAAPARPDKPHLALLPTGAGDPKVISIGDLSLEAATGSFLPDGKRIVFTASRPSDGTRLYALGVEGGAPRPLSPVGYRSFAQSVSPDGKFVVASGPDQKQYLFPLDGGEPAVIPGFSADESRQAGPKTVDRCTYTELAIFRSGCSSCRFPQGSVSSGRTSCRQIRLGSSASSTCR